MSNDLLDELRTAYQARMAAREKWMKSRESVGEARLDERAARDEYDRAAMAVEDIERELLTGESSLPLMDAARRNGHADPASDASRALGLTLSDEQDAEPDPPAKPKRTAGRKRKGEEVSP